MCECVKALKQPEFAQSLDINRITEYVNIIKSSGNSVGLN